MVRRDTKVTLMLCLEILNILMIVKMMIATLRDFRISQDQILDALEKRYGLTAEEAARYLE